MRRHPYFLFWLLSSQAFFTVKRQEGITAKLFRSLTYIMCVRERVQSVIYMGVMETRPGSVHLIWSNQKHQIFLWGGKGFLSENFQRLLLTYRNKLTTWALVSCESVNDISGLRKWYANSESGPPSHKKKKKKCDNTVHFYGKLYLKFDN